MGIKVVVKNNNYEKALSIFKRKVKDSGMMYELREREYYKKPSMVKKEMKNKAKARNYWKKVKLLEEDSRKRGRKF
jgi:small subunit ribosomal protein S21